jgi:cytochrome c
MVYAGKVTAVAALACATLPGLSAATGLAWAGDAAKGERVFKKCMARHSVAGKTNKVRPYLEGVVNRPVATAGGYAFSDGMKEFAAGGKVWDDATLDLYLANPRASVPKTKMAFPGLKKPEDRADLIAYLLTKP